MSGSRRSNHATGMAGEFFVMERLFRLGYEPALTLGNAKSIDILVYKPDDGKMKRISVKAVRSGSGKWGIGKEDFSGAKDLVFVFLRYRDFDDPASNPDVWVIPAPDADLLKQNWLGGTSAIYSGKKNMLDLEVFKSAWHLI